MSGSLTNCGLGPLCPGKGLDLILIIGRGPLPIPPSGRLVIGPPGRMPPLPIGRLIIGLLGGIPGLCIGLIPGLCIGLIPDLMGLTPGLTEIGRLCDG